MRRVKASTRAPAAFKTANDSSGKHTAVTSKDESQAMVRSHLRPVNHSCNSSIFFSRSVLFIPMRVGFPPLQMKQSAAALGFAALFRGISPASSPDEGQRKQRAASESVGTVPAYPVADSESDVERAVREQMERHRARRKRRTMQREE